MDKRLKKYIRENHSVIYSKKETMKDLSIIDNDLKDYEIFLIGENHGVKANVELKMKFLKYFKKKINFKYYICELPFSMTYFLNRYLETGNDALLKDIYKYIKGTYAWNKDEYDYWRDLYKYNKTLPRDDKIILIGIDIEHQPKNAFRFMEYCLNNGYYSKFEHVNNNLLNMLEVYHSNNFNGIRDQKLYENFLSISSHLPKGKYFGQIGLSHVFQRAFPYVNWFASFLRNEISPFKGKVLSVAYAYQNCKYLYPTKRKNYVSHINTLDLSMVEFKNFINSKYAIFKLNQKDSPFDEKLIWPLNHKFPENGVTTDYFQYLVVIKDSEEMDGFY